MRVLLTMPNVQFLAGSEKSAPIKAELEAIGFMFRERWAGGAWISYAVEPVAVELETAADVIELQRRIGLPLVIDDGTLEIRQS